MGIFGWARNWWHAHRARRELAAVDHLKRVLMGEKGRLEPLIATVQEIEEALIAHDFPKAERFIPTLAKQLEQKEMLDKLEKTDVRVFKKTLLADLRSQVRGLR